MQRESRRPTRRMQIDRIPVLVRRLSAVVRELGRLFPGRPFTLDGHLVGSIGEVLAAHLYGLELLPPSAAGHDARTRGGRLVQIKMTQGRTVGLRVRPEHLLVLSLSATGEATEVYNGPGSPAWKHAGRMQKNGQRAISVSKLRTLMEEVPKSRRIRMVAK